jgi:hypothetical protein
VCVLQPFVEQLEVTIGVTVEPGASSDGGSVVSVSGGAPRYLSQETKISVTGCPKGKKTSHKKKHGKHGARGKRKG